MPKPKVLPVEAGGPKRRRKVQHQNGENRALSEALLENVEDDPRLCDAPAVIRYPKPPDPEFNSYPENLWGQPILDDYGQRQYAPCEKYAVKGTHICNAHGASIPVVKKKAETLLAECRDRLMHELLQLALDERVDTVHRLAAMKWGLERSGFQAGVTVSLGVKPWQEALTAIKDQLGTEESA